MFNPAFEQGPSFDRARSQIATPFQYIDIALDAAASNQIVNVAGDFLYVDAGSTGAVTLELNNQYNDPSAPFYVQPGFGLAALFKQLKLSWVSQPGKFVRLMYSTGDRVVPTNSTTVNGVVSTIDSALSRTLANQAFLGLRSDGAVAGQYAHSQLWNPVGSGKDLYLESMSVSSSTAQIITVGSHNVAYTEVSGPANTDNKLLGNAVGVAQLRGQNNAALLFTKASRFARVLALTDLSIQFREPVVIRPGYGAIAYCNVVNADLSVNFEWFEL